MLDLYKLSGTAWRVYKKLSRKVKDYSCIVYLSVARDVYLTIIGNYYDCEYEIPTYVRIQHIEDVGSVIMIGQYKLLFVPIEYNHCLYIIKEFFKELGFKIKESGY